MTELELTKLAEQIGELGATVQRSQTEFEKRYDGQLKDELQRNAEAVTASIRAFQTEQLKLEADKRIAAEEDILKRVDAVETKLERGAGATAKTVKDEHRAAFRAFLCEGETPETRAYLPNGEKRTLMAGDDSKGGFLIPPSVATEIDKNITIIDAIRAYAFGYNGKEYIWNKRTGVPTMYWVAEGTRATSSSSLYGRGRIQTHWGGVDTPLTNEMLADASQAEAEAISDATEAMGYGEGYCFVLGTGVGQPMGFLSNVEANAGLIAAGGRLVNGLDAAHLICCDDFINLKMSVKPQYRSAGRYAMSDATFSAAQKLKDDEGHYLWRWPEGITGSDPTTINGSPFFIADDMPDDGTTLYKALVFADWQRWYAIVDGPGAEVLRNPYISPGNVVYHWWRRVGGDIKRQEAGSILRLL
jgi:HK97 family phage major capsid protein